MSTPSPNFSNENVVWSGTPSQKNNLGIFALCAVVAIVLVFSAFRTGDAMRTPLLVMLLLPIAIAGWRWLMTNSLVYTLTDQRMTLQRGVFTHVTDNVELYRIKDYHLTQTLMQRMLGTGTIVLRTTTDSAPQVMLDGMNDSAALWERIRALVEARRDAKGVREIDMNAEPGPH